MAERAPSGHRRYPRSVLRRVAFVVFAQRVGLTLEEIRPSWTACPRGACPTRRDWSRLSRSWSARIDARIAELERLRAGLAESIGCGCLSLDRCAYANPGDRAGAAGPGSALLDRRPARADLRAATAASLRTCGDVAKWLTRRSAKPLFMGSTPIVASLRTPLVKVFTHLRILAEARPPSAGSRSTSERALSGAAPIGGRLSRMRRWIVMILASGLGRGYDPAASLRGQRRLICGHEQGNVKGQTERAFGSRRAREREAILARKSVVIRLAGESGEGVISWGDILTQAAARGGYWAQTFRTYPAEIKGGPCMFQVRIGEERIYSIGNQIDLLVCFNQEAWDLHWDSLGRDGVILYDETAVKITDEFAPPRAAGADEKLAKEIGGSRRGKNMVAVGAVCGRDLVRHDPIEELMLRRYAHKGGVGRREHRGAARRRARERRPPGLARDHQGRRGRGDRILLSGNQAIAAGAVARRARLLRRLPDHPGLGHPGVAVGQLPAGRRHHDPVRGRDRLDLASVLGASLRRREGDDRHLRPRPVADDRADRLCRHRRDPVRDHRRPARRPVHGHADQDRAVRPQPRPLRRPRRGAARGDRADHRRRLLLGTVDAFNYRRDATRCRSSCSPTRPGDRMEVIDRPDSQKMDRSGAQDGRHGRRRRRTSATS